MSFLLRWAFAAALLIATYNPTQWNYLRWGLENYSQQLPLTVLLGLILMIGYIIYLRATLRSIGLFGMFLVLALVASFIWVLYDQGVLRLDNPTFNTWIALFALSVVLGVGLSWSLIRRKFSGQVDMDDVEE